MCETSISVWFVCRLCRGSFGQVDAFIEHKKQKHFNQFQNTTSIVFEESDQGIHQIADAIIEPPIKIEANDEDHIIPFSSEIIDELNLALVEPKSELITYECKLNPDNENNFFGLEQPEQNPYVLLKRLTSDEIQRACVLQHQSTFVTPDHKIFENSPEPPSSLDVDSNIIDHNEVEKCTGIKLTVEHDLQCECKLCSKQLESEAQLKIHVGICALYHEDQNRFCVTCNRKYCDTYHLKLHRLRFHGTEEEKLSLYKFKCHVCPKKYRDASDLRFHMESHKTKKQQVSTSNWKLQKCSHPNCKKGFRFNSLLQRHIDTTHSDIRPFSCSFPNCDRKFAEKATLKSHIRTHTGERPYQCTVDNCNKTFMFSSGRSKHLRTAHRS